MNKVYGTLGMAARARKVSMGESVIEDIRHKKAKLVVVAEDASANTIKRITDKCHFYEIDYVFIESSASLNQAIGKTNYMAVAILEEGFAQKIKTCLMKG